jgi:hypothetical protein
LIKLNDYRADRPRQCVGTILTVPVLFVRIDWLNIEGMPNFIEPMLDGATLLDRR